MSTRLVRRCIRRPRLGRLSGVPRRPSRRRTSARTVEVSLEPGAVVNGLRPRSTAAGANDSMQAPSVCSVEGATARCAAPRSPSALAAGNAAVDVVHRAGHLPRPDGGRAASLPADGPRVLAPPQGESAHDRHRAPSCGPPRCTAHGQPVVLDPAAAADRILEALATWGELEAPVRPDDEPLPSLGMTTLGERTWIEVHGAATERTPLLVVPLGSCEQHGPHLPLDTDTRIAVALADRLAAAGPPAVVAPPLAYGASGEHAGFTGTLSIGQAALELRARRARPVGRRLRRAVLVNGHGGNVDALERGRGAATASRRPAGAGVVSRGSDGDAHAGRTRDVAAARSGSGRRPPRSGRGRQPRPLAALMPALRGGGRRRRWRPTVSSATRPEPARGRGPPVARPARATSSPRRRRWRAVVVSRYVLDSVASAARRREGPHRRFAAVAVPPVGQGCRRAVRLLDDGSVTPPGSGTDRSLARRRRHPPPTQRRGRTAGGRHRRDPARQDPSGSSSPALAPSSAVIVVDDASSMPLRVCRCNRAPPAPSTAGPRRRATPGWPPSRPRSWPSSMPTAAPSRAG